MTTLQEHVESWLRDGHGYDQIIRCANRVLAYLDDPTAYDDLYMAEEIKRIGERRRRSDEEDGFFAIEGGECEP